MKQFAIAGVIAVVLGIIVGTLGGLEWFVVPAIPVVIAAALLRTSRLRAALITAGIGFVTVLAYLVLVYALSFGVDDRASDVFCDEVCVSRAEHWRVVFFVSSIIAGGAAVASGLVAFFLVAPNESAVGSR